MISDVSAVLASEVYSPLFHSFVPPVFASIFQAAFWLPIPWALATSSFGANVAELSENGFAPARMASLCGARNLTSQLGYMISIVCFFLKFVASNQQLPRQRSTGRRSQMGNQMEDYRRCGHMEGVNHLGLPGPSLASLQ